jgi:hypothetical protein
MILGGTSLFASAPGWKRQPMAFLLVDVLEISYTKIVFVRVEWR